MTGYCVVAEFERPEDVRDALRRLFTVGLEADAVEIRGSRPSPAVSVSVRADEELMRAASGQLARAGATRMRWLDGDGSPLRGPGRARSARGWQRPRARRRIGLRTGS